MSTTDPKPRKQKQREPRSQPVPNGTERFKTVVRRLPPNLPEEIFWQSVEAWVTDDTVSWKSYHPGKLRTKRMNKEGIPSRAYIAFKSEAQVATFGRAYDGHLFRDKAGNESHAVVEYAPFQKVPAEKKKADARNNTIDKDEDYLSFLESLKGAAKTESVSLEALIAASQPRPPPTTTPLLEALKAEKSAQKDKEAILRNHAHYKELAIAAGSSSKKEDAKKKAPVQHGPKLDPPASVGKKAKRAAAALGKTAPVAAAPASAPPPPPTARHRAPRAQPGKGDATPAVTTEIAAPSAPVPAQGQQRKNRPVIGLGRHFEAALSGAGVSVAQAGPGGATDRKRRDRGGESVTTGSGTGGGLEGTGVAGKQGKQKERPHPALAPPEVVPSILQRPLEVGAEAVAVQRAQSPNPVGHAEGGAGAGGRGNARRGRGRGRGGHRGG